MEIAIIAARNSHSALKPDVFNSGRIRIGLLMLLTGSGGLENEVTRAMTAEKA